MSRQLLLVEDNPADADLLQEYLEQAGLTFRVERVGHIDAAQKSLQQHANTEVVILDLYLPDSSGVDSVRAIRTFNPQIPIVVMTGTDDEQMAIGCIDAGAQEYLPKPKLSAETLRRSITYAITRAQESRLDGLRETIARLRHLSTDMSTTTTTAHLSDVGAVRTQFPNAFQEFVVDYIELLHVYRRQGPTTEKPDDAMARLATRLGDAGSGPRDLIDVHLGALDTVMETCDSQLASELAMDGRLLALEMMGLLVDYYRTGARRTLSNWGK